jgi:hypothetical protein
MCNGEATVVPTKTLPELGCPLTKRIDRQKQKKSESYHAADSYENRLMIR